MSGGGFGGVWRVHERVFSPAGEALGAVFQRRSVEDLGGGHLRVTQDCTPEARLAEHAMGRFRGHHVFEMTRLGAQRLYHGPAVLGRAVTLGDGGLVGEGIWPALGWAFTSWSVLVEPARQLTGGCFFEHGVPLAVIWGTAQPEEQTHGAPMDERREGETTPGRLASSWGGSALVVGEARCRRTYDGPRLLETTDTRRLERLVTAERPGLRADGTTGGRATVWLGQRFGALTELRSANASGEVTTELEILDSTRGHLVVLRRTMNEATPRGYEVLRLRPEGAP